MREDTPAPLAGREEGRLLLGRDRRVPALRARRGHRRDDPGDDRPRPQGLPPALVARREEDPLRRQGLLALRGGPRHEEADEDRRVALPRQRRVHLGGERLRLVAGQPLGRVLAPPREPQQRDLPLRHARGPEGPAHRRLLREPEPALRRRRRLPLLPVLPELPDRDGPVRGQPHRGQPGPGDGGAAAQGREAALREAPGDRAGARRRGREGRRRRRTTRPASAWTSRASRRASTRCPWSPGNYFHLLAGQGLRRLVLGAALHRGRVRGDLPPRGRDQVDLPRLLDEGPEGGRPRGQDRGGAGLGERRAARPPEGEGRLRHVVREGLRVEEARDGGRPLRDDLPRRAARGVAADLRRRLALVPRLLLRQGHARPRLEGDAREVRALGRGDPDAASSSTGCSRRWSAS